MANRRPTEPLPIAVDLDRALRDAVARGGLPIPPYPAVALRIQEVVSRKEFGLAGRTVVSLCRCGHSGNKPFCDATHKQIGFEAVETAPRVA